MGPVETDDVELLDLRARGGADTIAVHDLAATGMAITNVDFAATLGGSAGAPG
jgi:hypothetical protein